MSRSSHLKGIVSGVAISVETVASAASSTDYVGFFIRGGPEDPVGLDQWAAVVVVEWTDAGAYVIGGRRNQGIGCHAMGEHSSSCPLVESSPLRHAECPPTCDVWGTPCFVYRWRKCCRRGPVMHHGRCCVNTAPK